MKLNREKFHRELWFWISKHPEKEKTDWPAFIKYKKIDSFSWDYGCFACGEAIQRDIYEDDICINCPLDWGDNKRCWEIGTIYDEFVHEEDLEKKSIMAEVIACMEWK